jgi:hypothetical protein
MSTITNTQPDAAWVRPILKLHWGPIIGGSFVALGVWILLYAFGLAVGLTAIDASDPDSARTAGMITGIWSVIVPLIALFIGGLVAARTAGAIDRIGGVIHGAVLWALTLVAGALVVSLVLSSLIGGATSVAGKAAEGVAGGMSSASQSAQPGEVAQKLGIDSQELLAPINRRLQQEGKPQIQASQLNEVVQDVLNRAMSEGRLSRDQLVVAISDNTALSRTDAEELSQKIEAQYNAKKGDFMARVEGMKQQAKTGALNAADTTGKVFWGVFLALALGLVSALCGAAAGVTRSQRAASIDQQVVVDVKNPRNPA